MKRRFLDNIGVSTLVAKLLARLSGKVGHDEFASWVTPFPIYGEGVSVGLGEYNAGDLMPVDAYRSMFVPVDHTAPLHIEGVPLVKTMYVLAFFDSDKNFISGLGRLNFSSEYFQTGYTLPVSEIPDNAAFFVVCSVSGSGSYSNGSSTGYIGTMSEAMSGKSEKLVFDENFECSDNCVTVSRRHGELGFMPLWIECLNLYYPDKDVKVSTDDTPPEYGYWNLPDSIDTETGSVIERNRFFLNGQGLDYTSALALYADRVDHVGTSFRTVFPSPNPLSFAGFGKFLVAFVGMAGGSPVSSFSGCRSLTRAERVRLVNIDKNCFFNVRALESLSITEMDTINELDMSTTYVAEGCEAAVFGEIVRAIPGECVITVRSEYYAMLNDAANMAMNAVLTAATAKGVTFLNAG